MAKHAFVSAWLSGIQGQNIWSSALIGGVSSLSGEGLGYIKNAPEFALVAANAVVGGTISVIGGGKFANGALTGTFTEEFNALVHGHAKDNRLKVISYIDVQNTNGTKLGAELNLDFTDPRITEDTKVYQMVHMEGESGWDDGDLHENPVTYPFASYEGNNTVNFYDQSLSALPYKNGDYFNATIYIMSPNGSIAKIDWGWHISNNRVYLKPINIR